MSSQPINQREQDIKKVVSDHSRRLSSIVRKLVRDPAEVDDVVQEVFAEFIEVYDLNTAVETVGAWLATVARNKVFDRFRKNKVQAEHRLFVQAAKADTNVHVPGNEWMQDWLREELVAALEQLPEEQRDVFVWHELEDKSFKEISRLTGVSVNTLLSRKRYAVLALREYLKEVYDELE